MSQSDLRGQLTFKDLFLFCYADETEDAAHQKSTLLRSVSSQTYSQMRNLVSLAEPGDKSFEELLLRLLKAHFNTKPSETVQHSTLNSRGRRPGESVVLNHSCCRVEKITTGLQLWWQIVLCHQRLLHWDSYCQTWFLIKIWI